MGTTIYRLRNGSRVPSVTTVLSAVIAKPALLEWANKIGRAGQTVAQFRDPLADIGTAAHEMVKTYLTGREPEMPPLTDEQMAQATICFSKFLDWSGQHALEVIQAERPLVSEELRYGGTIDVLGKVDDLLGILDLKTGKAVYDDYLYQLGGYTHLAREHGHPVEDAWLLRIGRSEDEGFEVVHWGKEHLELGFCVFQSALRIYRLQQDIGHLDKGTREKGVANVAGGR